MVLEVSMSKERELLNRCAVTLKARDICPLLLTEISELLAQPEQEQENLELVRKLGFEAGYLLAIKECSKTLSAYLG